MKRKTDQKAYMKWMVLGLVIALSLVWFAGCGTKSGDASDDKTTGVTQEEPKTNADGTTDTTGQKDSGTEEDKTTEGSDSNETDTSNSGTTSGDNSDEPDTSTTPATPATPASTCTIQINCSLLVGEDLTDTGLETLVPANGVILGTTKVTLNPGETVYDVTLRVTKAKKIHMASQGSAAMGNLYVAAISNIYEKAYNSKSGWVYLINGKQPGVGSGVQKLKAGDALVWAYSLNLGNDL